MSKLHYDICYYDTLNGRKCIIFRNIDNIEDALHMWERADNTVGRDKTIKIVIMPVRKESTEKENVVCQTNVAM